MSHMYNIRLNAREQRRAVIASLKKLVISSVFHYVPLHSAPFGLTHSRHAGDMGNTNALSDRLLRLPLWVGLDGGLDRVVRALREIL